MAKSWCSFTHSLHSHWLRRAEETTWMFLLLPLLLLCQWHLSISLLTCFLFVFLPFFFFFLVIESCFPCQTAYSSCSVYYTQHRKEWKGTNLGRETKACNKLYSQLPCSMQTENKRSCHADTYSWKLGLLGTAMLKAAFQCLPPRLPLCCALREHSTTYWHRYKSIPWTRDSSGKLWRNQSRKSG